MNKPKYSRMIRKVLLLNASEEILNIVDWIKAVKLLNNGKALNYSNDFYEIKTSDNVVKLPKTIILKTFVRVPFRRIPPTRKNIFLRDQYTCQYCKVDLDDKNATLDHVVPKSKGGGSTWENLVTSCHDCNLKKGNKPLKDCGLHLEKKPKPPFVNILGLREYIYHNQEWKKFLRN